MKFIDSKENDSKVRAVPGNNSYQKSKLSVLWFRH